MVRVCIIVNPGPPSRTDSIYIVGMQALYKHIWKSNYNTNYYTPYMAKIVKVQLTGNSMTVAIPAFIVYQLGIKIKTKMNVKLIGNQIVYDICPDQGENSKIIRKRS